MEELGQPVKIVSGEVPGKLKSPHIISRAGFTMRQMGQLPRAPTKIGAPPKGWKMSCSFYEHVIFLF